MGVVVLAYGQMPYSTWELEYLFVTHEMMALCAVAPSLIVSIDINTGEVSLAVTVLAGVAVLIQPSWKASTRKITMPTTTITSMDNNMGLVVIAMCFSFAIKPSKAICALPSQSVWGGG